MTALIRPVILSGGTGTRLWPVSREGMAKQLLPLTDDLTMLEKTLTRVVGAKGFGAPIIIGSHAVRFILKEQAEKVASGAKVVLEPARRDTMAAVLLSAVIVAAGNDTEVLAVMPSDHMIAEEEAFRVAVRTAAAKVAESGIAVIGVQPTEPATGYGYIRPGAASGEGVRAVERFVEKPDALRAEQLIYEGCLWNAGIFCFRAGWLIEAMRAMMPEDVARVEAAVKAMREDLGMFIPGPSFAEVTSISFDHAFMEKTRDAHVAAAGFTWSDVGDWNALWK
ncbi:MAG: mannose-1-phosphate guanylyltransferase, partial [Paracoccaceae bacterium]